MLEEVTSWLRFTILPSLDFKRLNRKGHRRCIQAKKDLFAHAATMHFKLGLPMTACSFYFRGVNFERKQINTFGVDDEDLKNYMQLLNADIQDTIIANKTYTAAGAAAAAKKPAVDLEQTRVEKMADMSVINELKQE